MPREDQPYILPKIKHKSYFQQYMKDIDSLQQTQDKFQRFNIKPREKLKAVLDLNKDFKVQEYFPASIDQDHYKYKKSKITSNIESVKHHTDRNMTKV